MSDRRTPARLLVQLALLFCISACVNVFAPNLFLLRNPSTFLLFGLALALRIHVTERVIDPTTRNCLSAVAGMLMLWMVFRGAKYIAFEETEWLARHLWYLYYLPTLAIPQLSLVAALYLGRPSRGKAVALLTTAVSGLLFLLALLNDLHQWMFRFAPGFAGWDSDYTRGPLFLVIYLWSFGVFFAGLLLLFRRCRLSENRRQIWAPLIPVAFGVCYFSLYALGLWPHLRGELFGEYPEAAAFTMAGVWLSLIRIGLIPSNEGYGELFEASDLAAQIADSSFRVIYRSAEAEREPSRFASNLRLVCLLGAYIKRYANLSLLAANQTDASTEELRQNNERVLRLSESMRAYGRTIDDTVHRRELLDAKIRIHDEMNRMLLATQRALEEDGPRGEILSMWRSQTALLRGGEGSRGESGIAADLEALAGVIGMKLRWQGTPEGEDPKTLRLFLLAAREAMANAAKHAGAEELTITVTREPGGFTASFTNDGSQPEHEITETGGLANLRGRLEESGGRMWVASSPRFCLKIWIPTGGTTAWPIVS